MNAKPSYGIKITVALVSVLSITCAWASQQTAAQKSQAAPRDSFAELSGEWEELSCEIEGTPHCEWERDAATRTFIPVDTVWRLSSKHEPAFTRRVLRGNTEITSGDLTYGRHTVDTSVTPHRITFHGFRNHRYDPGLNITGVFQRFGDMLVIALPKTKFNRSANRYESARIPTSFSTRGRTDVAVYTLRRRKN